MNLLEKAFISFSDRFFMTEEDSIPKKSVEEYLKRLQEQQKKVFLTREEFDEFKTSPVEGILGKLGEGIGRKVEERVAEQEIGRKVQVAVDGLASRIDKEVENMGSRVNDEVAKMGEKLNDEAERAVVAALNKIEGTKYGTMEEAIKQVRKARTRQRAYMIALGTAAALGLMGTVATWYHSNRRTAEGAVGRAQKAEALGKEAIAADEKTRNEFYVFRDETARLRAKEKMDRDKQQGELEQRLTGQITDKLDKTEWGARAADLEKGIADAQEAYKQLDTLLKGELAKDISREKAYNQYKMLAESSKKEIDALRLRITGLQTEFSTRQYTDAEIARARTEYEGTAKELRQKTSDLLEVIKKMQSVYEKKE